MSHSLRQIIGAALLDWPRYEWWLRADWKRIRNRRDELRFASDARGVECRWKWTTDLHAAKVFPSLGRRLLAHSTAEWPIVFRDRPAEFDGEVQVSFVIGHRGSDRLHLLDATLETIAAQRGVAVECIVVEQSAAPELQARIPTWVRYFHTPLPDPELPYCRSWALNCGARQAKGRVLVLHDNDILVPQSYAEELWSRHQEGFELVNLKRFIFYLDEARSAQVLSTRRLSGQEMPAAVMQNALGGGSIAMSRDAFLAVGGYDESFRGWGGEDNEFWERASTRRKWPFGYVPMVHLWHAPQPRKASRDNPNLDRYEALSAIPPQERIRALSLREFGDPQGPFGMIPGSYAMKER